MTLRKQFSWETLSLSAEMQLELVYGIPKLVIYSCMDL